MEQHHRTVTVIGAGLAGLSAAFDLHRAGWTVTVLEARPRVGGRVHSVRSFAHGQVAEGGGEFIEESHTRLLALAGEFNLSLGRVGRLQAQDENWASLQGKAGPAAKRYPGLELRADVAAVAARRQVGSAES